MIVRENRAGHPTGGIMRADRRSRDPLGQRLPGHPKKLSDSDLVRLAIAQVATPHDVHTELARADGRALWKGRRTRAIAPTAPSSGRLFRAARYTDRGDAGDDARYHPGRRRGPGIMTAGRLPAAACPVGRDDTTRPEGQDRGALRLFDAKAAGWAAKYAPDGPLAGRLASLSAAVNWCAQAGDRVLDLGCGTGSPHGP